MKYVAALTVFTAVTSYVLFLFWMSGVDVLERTNGAGGAIFISNTIGAYVAAVIIMFWKDKRV